MVEAPTASQPSSRWQLIRNSTRTSLTSTARARGAIGPVRPATAALAGRPRSPAGRGPDPARSRSRAATGTRPPSGSAGAVSEAATSLDLLDPGIDRRELAARKRSLPACGRHARRGPPGRSTLRDPQALYLVRRQQCLRILWRQGWLDPFSVLIAESDPRAPSCLPQFGAAVPMPLRGQQRRISCHIAPVSTPLETVPAQPGSTSPHREIGAYWSHRPYAVGPQTKNPALAGLL